MLCIGLVGLILCAFDSGGCGTSTGDSAQTQQQQDSINNVRQQVGMPGITNFTELRMMKRLYEMRDQEVVTYSYIQDMQGRLWHLCDSLGYGLPYSAQFSNPQRPAYAYETHEQGNITLPQAEPNGLYMPDNAEGTWVNCATNKGEFHPVYVEPRVIVSPFKLNSAGDYAAK